ncbi:MAG: CopG family antitoxin [Spirochaetaceae bacterium]|nr:CopG family antitoxin [Spirochaetaceae bacterium]
MNRPKLDDLEQQIEDEANRYVPIVGKERTRVERVLEKSRKTRSINIRISEHDLETVKRKAEREGLPYQTLISSILHKYVNDQLVDEREITKTLHLLGRGIE